MKTIMRYCGRDFTPKEIDWIRRRCGEPGINRHNLSKRFCSTFNWLKPDGGLKDMSCRVAMLRMDRDGTIKLPAPKTKYNKPGRYVKRTLFGEPQSEIHKAAGDFDLHLSVVSNKDSALWNELIDRYHYLGFMPLPGAQLRYFVKDQDKIVSLLSFSAAAWTVAPRDEYIGWDSRTRKKNLHLVVNNSRFLILPWIRSKCLASRILAISTRQLADDWEARYHYRPLLAETFVERDRFKGTCYKAANWKLCGETTGRGKLHKKKEQVVPIKTVWVYPLEADFRLKLNGDSP